MRTKNIKVPDLPASFFNGDSVFKELKQHFLFLFLLLLWCLAPLLIRSIDDTAGNIDQSIWLLILLSLISFLVVTSLCWWLLQLFWSTLGLPLLSDMVSQFKTLPPWQQLGFYWASFALLLLAASVCLSAIC